MCLRQRLRRHTELLARRVRLELRICLASRWPARPRRYLSSEQLSRQWLPCRQAFLRPQGLAPHRWVRSDTDSHSKRQALARWTTGLGEQCGLSLRKIICTGPFRCLMVRRQLGHRTRLGLSSLGEQGCCQVDSRQLPWQI